MRLNLTTYRKFQVFLNYPFQDDFEPFENAILFGVIAAGLLPVCAKDLSAPDRPRLDMLVDIIVNCHYSIHDFSKFKGEGDKNYARFNMPIEMGMALFHALSTQRKDHRCAFFVPTPNEYKQFASDLAGLDAKLYSGDENTLLSMVYEWLRQVVPPMLINSQPSIEIQKRYSSFKNKINKIRGSGINGKVSFEEKRELMYQICSEDGWWDWRATRAGEEEFRRIPISWKD
jgi:hypothetical protein